MTETDEDLAQALRHLLHLANDLCLAYRTAIRRIESDALRESMSELDKSHDRYRLELGEYLTKLGHEATRSGDLLGVLERGRVIIGQLKGDDGILRAMASNELELSSAYREALKREKLPADVREIVTRALHHEAKHRKFYDEALGRFVG